jgi:hypothetical protein
MLTTEVESPHDHIPSAAAPFRHFDLAKDSLCEDERLRRDLDVMPLCLSNFCGWWLVRNACRFLGTPYFPGPNPPVDCPGNFPCPAMF